MYLDTDSLEENLTQNNYTVLFFSTDAIVVLRKHGYASSTGTLYWFSLIWICKVDKISDRDTFSIIDHSLPVIWFYSSSIYQSIPASGSTIDKMPVLYQKAHRRIWILQGTDYSWFLGSSVLLSSFSPPPQPNKQPIPRKLTFSQVRFLYEKNNSY